MLYINILILIALSGVIGYLMGKGKIEIVKRVEPTREQQERIDKQLHDQQEAIEKYNEMISAMTNYGG